MSLPIGPAVDTESEGTVCCKFWGLGSDGTVGANKNSIKIIGDHTDMYAQAYFEYDTKKSYGITRSHLRFGKHPILSTYLIKKADFVACHNASYLYKYEIITELTDGGTFLLNCQWAEEDLNRLLPAKVKKYIADHNIRFYIIDANSISQRLGLGNRSNMVLQSAFFKLANIIPVEEAIQYMKTAVRKTYRNKGEKIINMNLEAIDSGVNGLTEIAIPKEWKDAAEVPETADSDLPPFIKNIMMPIKRAGGRRSAGKHFSRIRGRDYAPWRYRL